MAAILKVMQGGRVIVPPDLTRSFGEICAIIVAACLLGDNLNVCDLSPRKNLKTH